MGYLAENNNSKAVVRFRSKQNFFILDLRMRRIWSIFTKKVHTRCKQDLWTSPERDRYHLIYFLFLRFIDKRILIPSSGLRCCCAREAPACPAGLFAHKPSEEKGITRPDQPANPQPPIEQTTEQRMEKAKKKQIEDRLKELIRESNQDNPNNNGEAPEQTPDTKPAPSGGPRVIRRRKGKPDHRIDS